MSSENSNKEKKDSELQSNPKVTMPIRRNKGKDWSSNDKVVMYIEESKQQTEDASDSSK